MTISSIDPACALIIVDLQQGTLANPRLIEPDRVVRNAERLLGAFRTAELPVVFVTFDPAMSPTGRTELGGRMTADADFGRPLPTLEPIAVDLTIVKGGWSAFSNPDLAGLLRGRGVGQLIIAGVATTFGVESTARDAYDAGFHVVVVTDAVTDMSPDSHDQAFNRVFPVLGETGSTDEVLTLVSTLSKG